MNINHDFLTGITIGIVSTTLAWMLIYHVIITAIQHRKQLDKDQPKQ